jgi:hypothetical protein
MTMMTSIILDTAITTTMTMMTIKSLGL